MSALAYILSLVYADFGALVLFVLGTCVVAYLKLHRQWKLKSVTIGVILFGCLFLISAWNLMESTGEEEKRRMREIMEATAPTFAQEVQRLGHERIKLDTPLNDPTYLSIIEAEIRWQNVTPSVYDIYTFRRKPNGETCLIVDSETDYDRNGKYEGEREKRTPIGEVFVGDLATIDKAFKGKPAFTDKPTTDRWGTWVSAYYPLFASDGSQEAVLGVDFDAAIWQDTVGAARRRMVVYLALFWALANSCVGAGALILARRNAQLQREAQSTEESRNKLQALIDSLDAVVWEWSPEAEAFVFVSSQAEKLLGWPGTIWVADKDFWRSRVWPDDLPMIIAQRQKAVKHCVPYVCEYRMFSSLGRIMWIKERGMRVKAPGGGVILRGILTDVTSEKLEDSQLEALNKQLAETARQAGMAQVASGVLHNVGNVLNSVVVSTTVVGNTLKDTKLPLLGRLCELLQEKAEDLPAFFANDPRAKDVPQLASAIYQELEVERRSLAEEMEHLSRNIAHIKEVVMMQQAYARTGREVEPVDVASMMDDSLRINESDLLQHRILVVRDYENVPMVLADRNRMLQTLVNLIRNAASALESSSPVERTIKISIRRTDGDHVSIAVIDNGIGIRPENFGRLFTYGFTTKSGGHGFGLYSGAQAAREMGGRLYAASEGEGKGATFTLELPAVKTNDTEPMLSS